MKIRVGIDLDKNKWIDWEGNTPPNLLPDPLLFNGLSKVVAVVTVQDRMEQTPYGLIVRRAYANNVVSGGASVWLGTSVFDWNGSNIPVLPLTPYTFVCYVRSAIPNSQLGIACTDPTTIMFSQVVTLNKDWTRYAFTFTTTLSSQRVHFQFNAPASGGYVTCDFEMTGLGLYQGRTGIAFNSGAASVLEDITDYVLSVSGDSGSTADITNMTPIDGQLKIALKNTDRAWSPRNTSSPFYGKLKPQTLIEVQMSTDGARWEPLWSGYYDSIALTTGTNRDQQAVITAKQGLMYMDDQRVEYKPQSNKTTTRILESILAKPLIPANRFTWQLGLGKLGMDTAFPPSSAYTSLDETTYTHPVAGAGMDDDTTIRSLLNELTVNEGGFAFMDRRGRLNFRRRGRLFPSIYDIP